MRRARSSGGVDNASDDDVAAASVFRAYARGGRLVGVYPEGVTHAEAHVQRIKTGAARIALGYEAQAPGRLTVVTVGLSFEARKRFRGRVLVSFGEPVAVASYLAVYREEPGKALHALTTAFQGAMEREVVHVERIDMAALARAVEALYRGELIHSFRYCSGAIPTPLRAAVRFAALLGAKPEVRGAIG